MAWTWDWYCLYQNYKSISGWLFQYFWGFGFFLRIDEIYIFYYTLGEILVRLVLDPMNWGNGANFPHILTLKFWGWLKSYMLWCIFIAHSSSEVNGGTMQCLICLKTSLVILVLFYLSKWFAWFLILECLKLLEICHCGGFKLWCSWNLELGWK